MNLKSFLLCSCAFGLLALTDGCSQHPPAKLTFDPAKWKMAATSQHNLRARMLDDLLAHNHFKGWSRTQLIALLGPPTATLPGAPHAEYYNVGHIDGAFPFHEQFLSFTFDQADQVIVDYGTSVD